MNYRGTTYDPDRDQLIITTEEAFEYMPHRQNVQHVLSEDVLRHIRDDITEALRQRSLHKQEASEASRLKTEFGNIIGVLISDDEPDAKVAAIEAITKGLFVTQRFDKETE